MLVCRADDLIPFGYKDSTLQANKGEKIHFRILRYFLWMHYFVEKHKAILYCSSTMKVEYIAVSKASKEAVWLSKFLTQLDVVPIMDKTLVMFFVTIGELYHMQGT